HLLRNAVDHGIESTEARTAAGKPPAGTVRISATRLQTGRLRIELADDGGGLDTDRLAAKAVERGIWTAARAAKAGAGEKMALIFEAGLSTQENVSETSGRGVGLDAVRVELEALGGTLRVQSQRGKGVTFELEVPGESETGEVVELRTKLPRGNRARSA